MKSQIGELRQKAAAAKMRQENAGRELQAANEALTELRVMSDSVEASTQELKQQGSLLLGKAGKLKNNFL